ncbi:hypothetical protein Tco_0537772 [Tanacetum coccineum]
MLRGFAVIAFWQVSGLNILPLFCKSFQITNSYHASMKRPSLIRAQMVEKSNRRFALGRGWGSPTTGPEKSKKQNGKVVLIKQRIKLCSGSDKKPTPDRKRKQPISTKLEKLNWLRQRIRIPLVTVPMERPIEVPAFTKGTRRTISDEIPHICSQSDPGPPSSGCVLSLEDEVAAKPGRRL